MMIFTVIAALSACATPLSHAPSPWTAENAYAPVLASIDLDHDGRVTEAEFAKVSYGAPRFSQVDSDGSGALDVAELSSLVASEDPLTFDASITAGPQPLRAGPGGPMGGQPPGGQGPGVPVGPNGAQGPGGANAPDGPQVDANGRRSAPWGPPGGKPGEKPGPAAPMQPGAPEVHGPPPGATPLPPGSRPHDAMIATLRVLETLHAEVTSVDPDAPLPTQLEMEAAAGKGGLDSDGVRAILVKLEAASTAHGLGFPRSLAAAPK